MNGTRFFRILASFTFIFFTHCVYAENPPQTAIATSHPLASTAGLEIMRQGGNAFDAAVTVASVLAVVEPYNSGLGGGGFWLLRDNRQGKARVYVIDAREYAPLAAKQSMFVVGNEAQQKYAQEGAMAAAIPGEVAGLVYLAKHYGNLPLEKTLGPAIRFAENGFALDETFVKKLKTHQSLLEKFPSSKMIFFPSGKAPIVGALLKQPALATVLKTIVKEGQKGFYQGAVAHQLVDAVKQNGGIWSLEDLKHYEVKVREPLKGKYHDMNITTVGLPSAGGIGVLTALNILSEFELEGLSDADHKHLIVESLRRVFCDRTFLSDPDFGTVNVKALLGDDHANDLRESISMNHATPSHTLKCGNMTKEGERTAHYSILDQQGNSVSATLTINSQFGSGLVAQGTGVLLNNEMDDFALAQGAFNKGNLVGHASNFIAPLKKPLSSMTPLFFETAQGMGILGTSGGSRIPSIMLLSLLRAHEEYLPQTWVMTPRFGHQYLPDAIFFEPGAFTLPLQNALKVRGHQLLQTDEPYGDIQAIFWDKKENKVYADSDPRGQGLALVETLLESPTK